MAARQPCFGNEPCMDFQQRRIRRWGRSGRVGGIAMNWLKNSLQHLLNPVHMYCRLMDFGMTKSQARRMCAVYERLIYRSFLGTP